MSAKTDIRSFVLIAMLSACSAKEPTHAELQRRPSVVASSELVLPAEAEPVLEPAAFLVDAPEKAFPRRATLARFGLLRFSPDDAGFAQTARANRDEEQPLELVVLENGPKLARVLLPDGHSAAGRARIAAYLEVTDLQRVSLERATLAPPSGKRASDVAVELFPGAPVEVLASEPGRDKVRSVSTSPHFPGTIEVVGWMSSAKYAHVYTPETRTIEPATHDVMGPFDIWTSPAGEVIAKIKPSETHPAKVRKIGEPKDGYQTVVVEGDRLSVRGIIPAATMIAVTDRGPSAKLGFAIGNTHYTLPKGTQLYAGPTAKQIGLLLTSGSLEDRAVAEAGRAQVAVYLEPWKLNVWVDEAVLEEAQRKKLEQERAAQARLLRVHLKITRQSNIIWRSDVERSRDSMAYCVKVAETNGPPVSGKARVLITLPAGDRSRWEASGPLTKDAPELKRCLESVMGSVTNWVSPGTEGVLDASLEVDPPNP